MIDYTFFSVNRYFNTLSNIGYVKQKSVDKLLLLVLIQEVVDNDFRGLINERDYNDIVQALYCLYGSDCLMPYPDYYNNKNRRVMYTGSISEFSSRLDKLEQAMKDIEGLEVLVPGEDENYDDGSRLPIRNVQDVAELTNYVMTGGQNPYYDVNNDGKVDQDDISWAINHILS